MSRAGYGHWADDRGRLSNACELSAGLKSGNDFHDEFSEDRCVKIALQGGAHQTVRWQLEVKTLLRQCQDPIGLCRPRADFKLIDGLNGKLDRCDIGSSKQGRVAQDLKSFFDKTCRFSRRSRLWQLRCADPSSDEFLVEIQVSSDCGQHGFFKLSVGLACPRRFTFAFVRRYVSFGRSVDVDAPATGLGGRKSTGDHAGQTAARADLPHHASGIRIEGPMGRTDDKTSLLIARDRLELAVVRHHDFHHRELIRIAPHQIDDIAIQRDKIFW